MKVPLVSIVIPTYNRAHIIGETLDSVVAQTYENWECIVVDDGSTDNTDEMMMDYLTKDSRFQYHHRPKDRLPGGNAARNYGFELSKGEYIQWFDSDDIMLPKMLEMKVDKIRHCNSNFVVCEGEMFISDKRKTKKKWKLYETENLLLDHILGKLVFGTNGPLFDKLFIENKKLFNEKLKVRQEWEFFSRLLMENPKIGYLKTTLYLYRDLPTGKRGVVSYTTIKQKMISERLVLNEVNSKKPFDPISLKKYRRSFMIKVKAHIFKILEYKEYKDLFYTLHSFLLNMTVHSSIFFLKKVFLKPSVLKNFFFKLNKIIHK